MKKTQFLEWIRNIRKTWITFLSIAVITALGIAVYLGIHYAAQGLKNTNSTVYQQENFWDFKILSALGFSQGDVERTAEITGIQAAEGVYEIGGTVMQEGQKQPVNLISMAEGISTGRIVKGRMPNEKTECVVSRAWAENKKVEVGDIVQITASSGGKQCLNDKKYKVSGIITYVGSSERKGTVLLPEDAFNGKAFNEYYTAIYVRMEGTDQYNIYDELYDKKKAQVRLALEQEGQTLGKKHYDSIVERIDQKIEAGRQKLKESRTELDQARKRLDEAKARLDQAALEIQAGEQKIAENEAKLAAGGQKIADGEQQLKQALEKLINGQKELEEGRRTLDEGWKELWESEAKIQQGFEQIREFLTDMINSVAGVGTHKEEQKQIIEERIKEYISTEYPAGAMLTIESIVQACKMPEGFQFVYFSEVLAQLDIEGNLAKVRDAYRKYIEAIETLSAGERKYASAYAEYEEGLSLYHEKMQQLMEGKEAYSQGQKELESGKQKLNEGKVQYDEGMREYLQGEEDYVDAEAKYDQEYAKFELSAAGGGSEQVQMAYWIVLDRNAVSSYSVIRTNAEDLESLGLTIALTFIVVAAMVCYSSISRMIEEQRKLLGVQKAIGFFSREIFIRYLGYALFSTAMGAGAGILIAYFVIQPTVLEVYQKVTGLLSMESCMLAGKTIAVSAAALLIACGAVWMACHHLLKLPATNLMKEEIPTGGGNFFVKFRFYQKLPLLSRIIIGNMYSDKRRVITTLAGVAGCMTLLVSGFTLKIGAGQVPELQYGQVVKFDYILSVKEGMKEEQRSEVVKAVKDNDATCIPAAEKTLTYKADGIYSKIQAIGTNSKDIEDYMNIMDVNTGNRLVVPEDGILLSKGTAEYLGLSEGDVLCIVDTRGNTFELNIKGVFSNYYGAKLIIDPVYYEKVFQAQMKQNRYYVQLPQVKSNEALEKELLEIEGVTDYSTAARAMNLFDSLAGTLNSILLILIVMSAAMAIMILFNLFLMHIRQKSRELAVMRVNGYTVRETKKYVGTETLVITCLGIVIGGILGSLLSEVVRQMLGNQILQIKEGIQPLALLISAAITLVFSMTVNQIALGKIKKLKLNNVSANE